MSVCWKIFDVYLQSIIWIKDTIMWCCCDVQGSSWGQRWAGVRYSGPGGLDASLEKWYKSHICWLFTGKKINQFKIRKNLFSFFWSCSWSTTLQFLDFFKICVIFITFQICKSYSTIYVYMWSWNLNYSELVAHKYV